MCARPAPCALLRRRSTHSLLPPPFFLSLSLSCCLSLSHTLSRARTGGKLRLFFAQTFTLTHSQAHTLVRRRAYVDIRNRSVCKQSAAGCFRLPFPLPKEVKVCSFIYLSFFFFFYFEFLTFCFAELFAGSGRAAEDLTCQTSEETSILRPDFSPLCGSDRHSVRARRWGQKETKPKEIFSLRHRSNCCFWSRLCTAPPVRLTNTKFTRSRKWAL